MASVAGRKKSIVSTTGLHIDTNANANTLLNKAASQSTSLYQQCSSLKARLMRIRGFPPYFSIASTQDSRQSTDPVTQLWDLFSLGTPLCYIFDQLPAEVGFDKINNSTFNQGQYEATPDRAKKHAIALFAMKIRKDEVMQNIPGCEPFTVTDLWDRNSTDGFVKVINTVTAIVDHLPSDTFEDAPPSPPTTMGNGSFDSLSDTLVTQPVNAKEMERDHVIKEILDTERKYVQDLEHMQKYSGALAQSNLMDQDTIHLLFPNLNKLLNFQRKFLIRLESTAELAWKDQRWGQHFLENEDEFIVYEPYCANYINAMDIMLANEQNLVPLDHLIKFKGELPGMLIKPIQRICKYPLLLKELLKPCTPEFYPHYDELKRGQEATKRIADKINEAQRRAENDQTVKSLHTRIDDWKGHHLENFGELLLDDVFVVTKSDIDREYHVFLFEKIILCCKEALAQPIKGGKGTNKNGSILKKQLTPLPLTLPGGNGKTQKNTPLLLKGRIFLGNVTQAVSVPARASATTGVPAHFPLAVWWKGDDDLEFFTLRCRREDQMRQWEAQINRLIKEAAQRRALERTGSGMSRILSANSTNPSPQARMTNGTSHYSTGNPISVYSQSSLSSASTTIRSRVNNHGYEEHSSSNTGSMYGSGPQGYPPHDGFDMEPDEDDFEDYPPSSAYSASGRGTPMGSRRTPNSLSMPPERESIAGYERPRAQTEGTDGPVMAQWRSGLPPLPSSTIQSPNGSLRPITPRLHSNMSAMSANSATSYASDASFGNGLPPKAPGRPALRSQFSSTRLRSGYESPNGYVASSSSENRGGRSATPNMSNVTSASNGLAAPPTMSRSRSASQPQPYIPATKAVPPPLPNGSSHWSRDHRVPNGVPTGVSGKRGSGSSQSTGESSDYSPNSSSPITPFGSSESSLGGGIRNSRSRDFDGTINGSDRHASPPVKVKVHFHEDIFVIQVPRSTEYGDLVEKVGRKIRLCGPRRDDGPLRVKYRDEDGDMVSLGSTEDVQMAFEAYRPGGQVTLFVT
ncbi:rho guanine nucleotide exchange factor scd1 [Crassisporium funariophilum]|nr:rho guanine nucleotide exchange factor scd1 [Crassisporium funariophilum]